MFRKLALCLTLLCALPLSAGAEQLPQMDCSTARIPITQAIYDLFTNTYGDAGPEPISSKTHGAWLNLADGVADIVFLAAPTQDELKYFSERGVDIEMKVYGYDGLVFMGNAENPIDNLTSAQIRAIFGGKIGNWQFIPGGDDASIAVYIRNPESGSQRLFESLVWDGYAMPDFQSLDFIKGDGGPENAPLTRTVSVYSEMEGVTFDVLVNQYAIGYNIMSYIDSQFGATNLKLFSVNGCAPTTENFASGDYPYLTTAYVAIRADEPEDSPARRLYDWVGSEESRGLIAENSTLTVSFSESVFLRANAFGSAVQETEAPARTLLAVSGVEASSTRDADGNNHYYESYMTDDNPSTCWTPGGSWVGEVNAIDEYADFRFDAPVNIAEIQVINGYGKSKALYDKNSRLKTALLQFEFEDVEGYHDDILISFDDFEYGFQAREFPVREGITGVRLIVYDVYAGSEWPEDLTLSEVRFMGSQN